jgi:diguanylate cyclase (GGDEF)-like protein
MRVGGRKGRAQGAAELVLSLLSRDLYLLIGLAVALFVVFSRRLGQLLEFAYQIDQERGIQLLPALIILTAVFIFHLVGRRREMRLEARQATERAEEMGRLVNFGQALARTLDGTTIRAAVAEHVPLLVPDREVWTLTRMPSHWEPLMAGPPTAEQEAAAAHALGETESIGGTGRGRYACFPMIVAGHALGVLGVSSDPPLSDHERRVVETTAALLGASIKNAELFRDVREHSVRDTLTGCFNRRHAFEIIDAELRRSRRSRLPLTIIMFDLDHFKAINDRFGHQRGDAVLVSVGERMRAVLRGSDVRCRYGGEEFVILLPDTPLAGARRVADTLRRDLESHPVSWQTESVNVTASFGIATIMAGDSDVAGIIGRADAALYRAKQEGRNCVRVSEEPVLA